MPTSSDPLAATRAQIEKQLDEISKELAGYEELKQQESRLVAALAALDGKPAGGGGGTRSNVSRQQQARDHLGKGSSSPADLARAMGVPATQASNVLNALKNKGEVTASDGKWSLLAAK